MSSCLTGLDRFRSDPAGRVDRSRRNVGRASGQLGCVTVAAAEGESGGRPIYSIGAVASMLGVETPTLRVWEERYGVVVPTRSQGAQRVYSRDELERLRFVVDLVEAGTTPADAHRLLAERLRDTQELRRPTPKAPRS